MWWSNFHYLEYKCRECEGWVRIVSLFYRYDLILLCARKILFLKKLTFVLEREKENEEGRGREKGRERIPSRLSAVSAEPDVGIGPQMMRSWPEPKPRVWYLTHRATQPPCAHTLTFLILMPSFLHYIYVFFYLYLNIFFLSQSMYLLTQILKLIRNYTLFLIFLPPYWIHYFLVYLQLRYQFQ